MEVTPYCHIRRKTPISFAEMGAIGPVVGVVCFVMVLFAALTSSVSIMEAVTASVMDKWNMGRKKACTIVLLLTLLLGTVVCLGYNQFYFELTLPNGTVGQVLDVMDYLSNYVLMPIVAIATCILVGWALSSRLILDEITANGEAFSRKRLYLVMVRFVTPVMLLILLMQALGILKF